MNRQLCAQACLLLASAALTANAIAQNYPSGPLRIVSPYPPGGGTDILARTLGQKLNERYGQPAVVENRSGANGTVGAAFVAKSAPDGHTLLIVPAGYAANPALYKNLPYDQSRELAPVSHLASGPLTLVVHPSLPAKNVKELIALAKAQPGALNIGSAGNGSLPHLSAELFNTMAGIKIVHIPFKGSGAAVIDVLSGQVPLMFSSAVAMMPHVKAGKLRAIGTTAAKRSSAQPEIPTVAEATGLKDYEAGSWYGLSAPAGTSRAIIDLLNRETVAAMKAPDIIERLSFEGVIPVGNSPEEFAAYIKAETAKWGKLIRDVGVKPE
ncbi:MAG: tripartite tricarboxylate transporter substrate binding protein [Betaproteobacteria bacterium]|nr:tripartite tricarboxylate transporter substrate binding protein [Betaproteobacteria bacterium]